MAVKGVVASVDVSAAGAALAAGEGGGVAAVGADVVVHGDAAAGPATTAGEVGTALAGVLRRGPPRRAPRLERPATVDADAARGACDGGRGALATSR